MCPFELASAPREVACCQRLRVRPWRDKLNPRSYLKIASPDTPSLLSSPIITFLPSSSGPVWSSPLRWWASFLRLRDRFFQWGRRGREGIGSQTGKGTKQRADALAPDAPCRRSRSHGPERLHPVCEISRHAFVPCRCLVVFGFFFFRPAGLCCC